MFTTVIILATILHLFTIGFYIPLCTINEIVVLINIVITFQRLCTLSLFRYLQPCTSVIVPNFTFIHNCKYLPYLIRSFLRWPLEGLLIFVRNEVKLEEQLRYQETVFVPSVLVHLVS